MHAHLTEPPPSLRSARPDLSQGARRVIAGAMAKSMDDRPGASYPAPPRPPPPRGGAFRVGGGEREGESVEVEPEALRP